MSASSAPESASARALPPTSSGLDEPTASLGSAPRPRGARILFGLALAVFLASRLAGLQSFPIFFLVDEAIPSVHARFLVEHGFRDEFGQRFPTYFLNGWSFNRGVDVYLHVLPYLAFGHSVFATRATQVVIALSAMFALGLLLRDFLGLSFWWAGVLLLSVQPAWFLHTRIAFEVVIGVSFWLWALYFYLRYRAGRRWELLAAIAFGALAFYSYNALQPGLAVTVLLLGILDFSYHRRHGRVLLAGAALAVVLSLPYLRFVHSHPGEVSSRLQDLGSYWVNPGLSLLQKLSRFGQLYAGSFSPLYWFRADLPGELIRHRMKGYAHLFPALFPFVAVGLFLCLRRFRSAPHRTVLVALVAAPVGGALVGVGVTRAMMLVVLASVLAAVAIDLVLRSASRRIPPTVLAAAVFVGLAAVQGAMVADALSHGSTGFREYGFYGMQYGSRQVYGAALRWRRTSPGTKVYISPDWANGTDDLLLFFAPDDPGIVMRNIDYYAVAERPLSRSDLLVMTATEFERTLRDPKFVLIRVEERIPFPDGSPGFVFARFEYSPRIAEILAGERRERLRPVEDDVPVAGETLHVAHSAFDIGSAGLLFDGDLGTLVRTRQVNPAVITVVFPAPRALRTVRVTAGAMAAELKIWITAESGRSELEFDRTYEDRGIDSILEAVFPLPVPKVKAARIELRDVHRDDRGEVHVKEIEFR